MARPGREFALGLELTQLCSELLSLLLLLVSAHEKEARKEGRKERKWPEAGG